jgi:hypothetical protein
MKRLPVAVVTAFTLLAALACSINIGGPDNPNQPVPISTAEVQAMQTQAKQAMDAGAQSGQVTLVLTEAQITSYLAAQLQAESDPVITDPQVYLRDGQVQVYGQAKQGYFVAEISIIISVSVDETGKPKIEIISADFGPLPVPEGLRDTIASSIGEAFTGAVGPAATGFRIETITIANGLMTITGRVK